MLTIFKKQLPLLFSFLYIFEAIRYVPLYSRPFALNLSQSFNEAVLATPKVIPRNRIRWSCPCIRGISLFSASFFIEFFFIIAHGWVIAFVAYRRLMILLASVHWMIILRFLLSTSSHQRWLRPRVMSQVALSIFDIQEDLHFIDGKRWLADLPDLGTTSQQLDRRLLRQVLLEVITHTASRATAAFHDSGYLDLGWVLVSIAGNKDSEGLSKCCRLVLTDTWSGILYKGFLKIRNVHCLSVGKRELDWKNDIFMNLIR